MSDQMGRTFARFAKLPPEIRIMIWKMAKPPCRIVEINQIERPTIKKEWNKVQEAYWRNDDPEKCGYEEDEHGELVKYGKLWGFKSDAPISALLFACRESRAVALEWYSQAFRCSSDNEGPGSVSIPQTYFNFQEDILFITPETFRPKYTDVTDAQISYDADVEMIWPEPILSGISDMAVEEDFRRVENLALLINDEWYPEWDSQWEWLSKIPERTFRNLKTLTVVVEYCVSSPHWRHVKMTTEEKADLVFMDAQIDVRNAFSFYQAGHPVSILGEEKRLTVPKPSTNFFSRGHAQRLTRETLTVFRKESIANGGEGWNMPTIEFKNVVPRKVRRALQNLSEEIYA